MMVCAHQENEAHYLAGSRLARVDERSMAVPCINGFNPPPVSFHARYGGVEDNTYIIFRM